MKKNVYLVLNREYVHAPKCKLLIQCHTDLGRFRIRSRIQRTNLNPNPDLIPDSESCVVESDLESESCRFESESDSDS